MISETHAYVIVDEWDTIWLETLASNRRRAWGKMAVVCLIPKPDLVKRGFKCVRVEIKTEDHKR
jgi:hypothetical protein